MEISKTHRVRFLVESLDHKECDGLTSSEIFWKIADNQVGYQNSFLELIPK